MNHGHGQVLDVAMEANVATTAVKKTVEMRSHRFNNKIKAISEKFKEIKEMEVYVNLKRLEDEKKKKKIKD